MSAYYNEIDPYAAQWLRNLIASGHIAPGDVDERSILEVKPDDLRPYTQCHFFAGIGGWSYALRLAGWPDDRPVWTGSCPCQPFSAAGAQRGSDDERHLWPAFFNLISECRPGRVFGEQVAGAAGLAWLDHVCADLEGAGYAAAAANLCAACAGAPHIRQRLYWVAHAQRGAAERWGHDVAAAARGAEGQAWERQRVRDEPGASGDAGVVANADPGATRQRRGARSAQGAWFPCGADADGRSLHGFLADTDGRHTGAERQQRSGQQRQQPQDGGAGFLGNASGEGSPEQRRGRIEPARPAETDRLAAWSDLEWIECSDGKARPTKPGIQPLAHGLSGRLVVGSAVGPAAATLSEEERQQRVNRVGVLRGAGNAIVPQVAALFIQAAMT